MKSVFIIKDRAEDLFMVVISDQSGSTFKPMTENAKELSSYLADEYSKTPISKPELTQSIDESMTIEGPSPYNSLTREKISTLSQKSETSTEIVPVTSVSEVALSEFSHDEFMNVVSYKAASFIADRTKTTFGYEVKRVRAMWDPSLSIPGTNRRGGWRCPVGTRYGGQITDRFGRQCGWGVARRIANAVSNIGERLEGLDDRKRNRRLERRNARMVRHLQGRGGGRVERGLQGIADVLDGGSTPSVRPQGRAVKPSTPDIIDAVEPRVPRQRRNKPRRRPQPSQVEPQRPVRPARPARPIRPARPVDGERLTIEEASDAQLSEPFTKYVNRKYGEYAKNVRLLNEQGKPAGMMTRRQWYAVNKPNLRDAWKDAHGRSAPQNFEPAPPRRPRNNRANRRNASVQQARRTATRRPEPNDVPEPAPARPARPARRRRSPDGRGFVTPGDGGAPNTRRVQNALPEGWNQGPGTIITHSNGDIIDQPIGEDTWFVIYRGGAKKGLATREDAIAWHKANVLGLGSSAPQAPPSVTTPNTPTAPARAPRPPNTVALKMNNLVDNHATSMPKLQPDNKNFVAVPIGNKGINTLQDANRYTGSLADIPDKFLLEVIQKRTHKSRGPLKPNVVQAVKSVFPSADDAEIVSIMQQLSRNMRRSLNEAPPVIDQDTKNLIKALKDRNVEFIQMSVGSGITSPEYYFHLSDDPTKWGRGYFLKKPDLDGERRMFAGKKISQHGELIGNIFAKELGFANGAPRLVTGERGNPFLLMDIFANNAEGKLAGRYQPANVADPRSRLFNGVLNAVLDAGDRHPGNGDQMVGNGAIPLDFGRAKFDKKTAQQQIQYLSNLGMDRTPWAGYKTRLTGLTGAARDNELLRIKYELQSDIAKASEKMRNALVKVDQVNSAYDAADNAIKTLRRDNLAYNIEQFASAQFLNLLMTKIGQ